MTTQAFWEMMGLIKVLIVILDLNTTQFGSILFYYYYIIS